jgi:MOSC domain-containing protein YiiM
MNDQMFVRRFTEALRPGTYLRIIGEGDLGAGDEVRVIYRPDHDLTIRDVFRIYTRDQDEAERLIAIPQMSDSWKDSEVQRCPLNTCGGLMKFYGCFVSILR